eukprot:Em0005g1049a
MKSPDNAPGCEFHPQESTTAEAVLACPPLQRALSKKLDNHAFQSLLSSSSPTIPSTGLDLHLDARSPCSHCRHGGDVVAQHNRLRDILANFCRRAHLSVRVEVGYGLARDHINSRPADILVQRWDREKPAAFDVTVTSLLTPVFLNNASASVGAAAYAAECRKHAANDTMQVQGVGMVMHTLSCGNAISKPKMLSESYSRLNMSLVRSVARAIMGREAVPGKQNFHLCETSQKTQPKVKDNSNIFDAQGDRVTPAKPPESDNDMEIEELPGNQRDDKLDAEYVHLPPEEVANSRRCSKQPQIFNKTPQEA